MYDKFLKPLAMAFFIAIAVSVSAQTPKPRNGYGAGILSSVQGTGLVGEKWSGERVFSTIELLADTYGVLSGRCAPGFRANFSRNFLLGSGWAKDGAVLSFYAGPGISAGYVRDHDTYPTMYFNYDVTSSYGGMAALSLKGGCMLESASGITVRIGLTIDAGVYIAKDNSLNTTKLLLYRNGLYRSYIPQITILYRL